MPNQWSDLPKRFITVSIGIPTIIAILSHRTTSQIFFQCVHVLCLLEWVRLCPTSTTTTTSNDERNQNIHYKSPSYAPIKLLFPLFSFFLSQSSTERFPLYLSLATSILYLSSSSSSHNNHHGDTTTTTTTTTTLQHSLHGFLYLTTSFHTWLQLSDTSLTHTLYLLLVVWNSDTGALLTGRISKSLTGHNDLIGETIMIQFGWGRKLKQWMSIVSPNKSFTGFMGGIIGGVITAVWLPNWMVWCCDWCSSSSSNNNSSESGGCWGWGVLLMSLWETIFGKNTRGYIDIRKIETMGLLDFDGWLLGGCLSRVWIRRALVGVALSIFGILGDVVESMVKRNSGKKDSGKLLPGHGGVLDRFDSTFFAVGVYFYGIVV